MALDGSDCRSRNSGSGSQFGLCQPEGQTTIPDTILWRMMCCHDTDTIRHEAASGKRGSSIENSMIDRSLIQRFKRLPIGSQSGSLAWCNGIRRLDSLAFRVAKLSVGGGWRPPRICLLKKAESVRRTDRF